jgi:hypothetical protein
MSSGLFLFRINLNIPTAPFQKLVTTYLHNQRYLVPKHKIMYVIAARRNTDAALHRDTDTFALMNCSNAHLSNQIGIRI